MGIALIFDMDGVLLDSHPTHRSAWRQLLGGAGKPVSDAELDFVLEGATRDEILRHFLGPLTPQQSAAYAGQKEAIFQQEESQVAALEGLYAFLDQLESVSIPMAVATSASRMRATRMLQNHALAHRFAAIVTGDDVVGGKSNPAIFLQACHQLCTLASEVVVIEDAITAIEVVKRMDMKCIGIGAGKRRAALLKAGADLVAPNFTNLGLSDILGLFRTSPPETRSLPAHTV